MSSIPYVADYYETLGVERDASTEEIKKAFRKLARESHPDVAKDDPDAATRFNKLRQAYETLVDPVKRTRYDRSFTRRANTEGGGAWRPPGGMNFSGVNVKAGGAPGGQDRFRGRGNNLDLEDIFGDFGGMSDFGFGATPPPKSSGPQGPRPGPTGEPVSGRDIVLQVDVPARTAELGGTITLHYPRLRRGDDGVSVYRYNELFDLGIAPGTRHGETIRVEKMGDAGANGGPYGDLVCDVRVVGAEGRGRRPEPREHAGREARHPREEARPPREEARAEDRSTFGSEAGQGASSEAGAGVGAGGGEDVRQVAISVVEALLGGRVEVDTPGGRVRVSVPPCTSSGARLRLRGKGAGGRDLYVELRIVVPKSLDEESRRLIERFAALNPDTPRE